ERCPVNRDGERPVWFDAHEHQWESHRWLVLLPVGAGFVAAHHAPPPSVLGFSGADDSSPLILLSRFVIIRMVVSKASSSAGWSWCWITNERSLIRHKPCPVPRPGRSFCSVPVRPRVWAVTPS